MAAGLRAGSYTANAPGAHSSAGRASAWHAEGRRFERAWVHLKAPPQRGLFLSLLLTAWELEYATCLKLMTYRDGIGPRTSQLTPEAAAGFPKVSNNGKTYDFTISSGFTRFSDGTKVTAASFKAAFDRNADPKMQSPAGAFLSDVLGSATTPVSGVQESGKHLVVRLTKAAPGLLPPAPKPLFSAIPADTGP